MARKQELRVVISGDKSGLDRMLHGASKNLDKLGKQSTLFGRASSSGFHAAGVAAKGLGVAVGATAVGIGYLVKQATEAEKVTKQTEAVLKSTGHAANVTAKEVSDLATAISNKTGIDDEAIQSSQNMLLTFTNVRNEVGKGNDIFSQATQTVTDMSVALGQDGKSSAIQLGKALNDPIKGITALQRVGVSFTEQQKKQITTMVESGRTLDAQKLILKELNKEFGGSAAAAATPVAKLKVAANNLAESLGKVFKPATDSAATAITKLLRNADKGQGILGRLKTATQGAGKELDKIFKRKDLDLGEKLKLSSPVLRRNFSPIVKELQTALEKAHIPAKLEKLFEQAAPRIMDALAASAPRAAGAFVKAFKGTSIWGKLLVASFIISKLGGFNAAGTWAAGTFAKRFNATVGKSPVFASAGKNAGKAFGAAIILGTVVGLAGIGSTIINKVKDELGVHSKLLDFLAPRNLLPKVTRGEGLAGKLWNLVSPEKKALGGMVPGHGSGDTVPAMLTPGEFVIRKSVVDKFGPTYFANINAQRFSDGGIVARANAIDAKHYPYVWGGGHSRSGVPDGGTGRDPGIGYDCSGAVSAILGVSPRVSGAFTSWGKPGPGAPNDTKVYANATHMFAVINGRGWGTSRENPGGGPGWLSYNSRPGFTIRHLSDGSGPASSNGSSGNAQEPSESGGTSGPSRSERQALAGSRLVNRVARKFTGGKSGINALSRMQQSLATGIDDSTTAYGQKARRFDQSEEDLGTKVGRDKRVSELRSLRDMKVKQIAAMRKRAEFLKADISKYTKLMKRLGKSRDKAKGAKRAKISERMLSYQDKLVDLMAEAKSLGLAINDSNLDLGDINNDINDVAATPDTAADSADTSDAGPSTTDKISSALSHIDALERAGDVSPTDAQNARIGVINQALSGAFGALTDDETLNLRGDLRDATNALTQATVDNTSAIQDLKNTIEQSNAIATSQVGIELATAYRALGDIVSGQIGYKTNGRSLLAGSGTLARY